MGALNSIHTKLTNLTEEFEENEQEHATPERSLRHRCLSGIDPRSPTENINRTPIIVEGTPNIHSMKAVKAKSISQNAESRDPRSPSTEFTRTPLCFGHDKSSAISDAKTSLKTSLDFTLPPNSDNDDAHLKNSTQDEKLGKNRNDSVSSSDNIVMSEGSLDESFDTAPLLEGSVRFSTSSNNSNQRTNSSASEPETESDNFLSSHNKLRCPQMNRILGHQTSFPVKVRSPLSLVENSPRVSLVQKKGLKSGSKVDNSQINPTVIDKENICH